MDIGTWVYKRHLAANGTMGKLWFYVRSILIKLWDPVCTFQIHGIKLKLPLSHQLPAILQSYPFYDHLPSRISTYIHSNNNHVTCIDVGANIGDTIASFYHDQDDIFLAIEPYGKFNKLLTLNWAWNKNVSIISDFCSSETALGNFGISEKHGTASIAKAENGIRLNERTLDDIIEDFPYASEINVIKIDTDGHDLEVIAGAIKTITINMPIILFECEPWDIDTIDGYINTLNKLQEIGYSYFLLYDSRGNFLGKTSLSDLSSFKDQLLYQMEHDLYDFDILVIGNTDIDMFYKSECDYFHKTCLPFT